MNNKVEDSSNSDSKNKGSKKLCSCDLSNVLWLLLTLCYIAGVVYYVFWFTWPEFGKLSLNEKGDFLAGISAPIAFLWIVLGFFQQSKELKQNTKALNDSANHQKEMAKQAKFEMKSMKVRESARFNFSCVLAKIDNDQSGINSVGSRLLKKFGEGKIIDVRVRFSGNPIHDAKFVCTSTILKADSSFPGKFNEGYEYNFTLLFYEHLVIGSMADGIDFEIHYKDADGDQLSQQFTFFASEGFRYNIT